MIVAGFGFRKTATLASLLNAYDKARGAQQAALIATPAGKAGPIWADWVALTGIPAQLIEEAALQAQETLTVSQAAQAAYATGSVAEASALAAAGANAQLMAPRVISDDRAATCALAIGESR